jgi:hypothetical protein
MPFQGKREDSKMGKIKKVETVNLNVTNLWRRKEEVMRKIFVSLVTATLVLGLAISAHAAFIDLGGGMIYDNVLDITWLADANYAQTSGYDLDGLMTWDQANTWATNLIYGGIAGWRLPTFDDSNPRPTSATSLNEIGSLLMALTNGNFNLTLSNYTPADILPFYNLPHLIDPGNRQVYWTGLVTTSGQAWEYYMA